MPTNNVLYEKKHRFMLILKEINILYNQADDEVINNEIPAFKAKQIKDMYNYTVIGLLEEGVQYQYIKDSKDSSKDIISVTIDGLNYRCKNTELYNILKNRYKDVMGIEYNGPKLKEIEKQEDDYKIPDIPKDNPNIDIQSFIPPKVYITPDNDFSKKRSFNIFKAIKQIIITFILIVAAFMTFMFIWGNDNRRNDIQNGWNEFKQSFIPSDKDVINKKDVEDEYNQISDPENWVDTENNISE